MGNSWTRYWQWCMGNKEFEWECTPGNQRAPGHPDSITAKQFLDLSCELGSASKSPWSLTLAEFVICWKIIKYGGKMPELEDVDETLKIIGEANLDVAAEKAREFASEQAIQIAKLIGEGGEVIALRTASRAGANRIAQRLAARAAARAAVRAATTTGEVAETTSGPIGWLFAITTVAAQSLAIDKIKASALEHARQKYVIDAIRRRVPLGAL